MKLSESIKPISYLKAHASQLVREIANEHKTLIITQNGEAKVIVQDIKSYENMKESLVLLKILAQSSMSKSNGKVKTAKRSFKHLNSRIKEFQCISK